LNQIIGSVGISATARHILMVGNAPMAASFARVGYRLVGRRIIFV